MMWKKKEIFSFVTIGILISCSIIIIENKNIDVKAAQGQNQQGYNPIGLDLNYVWNETRDIANAVHIAYHGKEIRKGRTFGSNGTEVYAKNLFNHQFNLTLGNNESIQLLPNKDYPNEYYTTFLNVTAFGLHINHPEYCANTSLPRDVPNNESYAVPSVLPYYGDNGDNFLNHNFSHSNTYIDILNMDGHGNWPWGGSITGSFILVPCQPLSDNEKIYGNVTYLNNTATIPSDQQDRLFLINETNKTIEKIQNITDGEGIILIHNTSLGYYINSSVIENCSLKIVRVNDTDNKITNIISRLRNGQFILGENMLFSKIITFSYDYTNPDILWPNQDFYELYNYSGNSYLHLYIDPFLLRTISLIHPSRRCEGIIIYSNKQDQTHPCIYHNLNWYRLSKSPWLTEKFPALPIFTVNYTVGKFLHDHANEPQNTVNGYLQQQYLEESHQDSDPLKWTIGVKAYDVVGNLTIPKSPDNTIILISNRHDSHAGECPADSGAGGAIVLGIAKYFKDHNLTPKYNLTFLQTTGEEFGYRGAQYYSDTHTNDNIKVNIGFDQLGMTTANQFEYFTSSDQTRNIVKTIIDPTNYPARTNYSYTMNYNNPENYLAKHKINIFKYDPYMGHGDEDIVWSQRLLTSQYPCETICFGKENWSAHHQTGLNFSRGDSLSNMDRNDLNVTFEMAWNITKYYTVNPNCKFTGNPTYTVIDSPHDPDTITDTARFTIPMKSRLPSDLVRVKAILRERFHPFPACSVYQDFVINSTTSNKIFDVTLPPYCKADYYHITLELYNSTGRVNSIWDISPNRANDTKDIGFIYLHPRGNQAPTTPQVHGDTTLVIGHLGKWNATTSDPNYDLVGEKWFWNYQSLPKIFNDYGPLYNASATTPQIQHEYISLGRHEIRVKAYDQYSDPTHPYESPLSQPFNVSVVLWAHILNQQQTHQPDVLHLVQGMNEDFKGEQVGGQNIQWQWNFGDQSNNIAQTQNAVYKYNYTGNYNVTLHATDGTTQLTGNSTIHVQVTPLDANFNLSSYHSSLPYASIEFTNNSRGISPIVNRTWDFGDGTIAYDNSTISHQYTSDGDYNVTLTVRDNQDRTDTDYAIVHIRTNPRIPDIPYIEGPGTLVSGSNATVIAQVTPTDRNLTNVSINITYPNGTTTNHSMTHLLEDLYTFTLESVPQSGQYTYTIWARDSDNQTNTSQGNFTMIQPYLSYVPPTPAPDAILNHAYAQINVSINDTYPTSAYLDWNDTLRGYWPMDAYNNTYLYDDSPYQNDGTFYNGINSSNITQGKYGQGLMFNNTNGYVDLGNDSSLNLSTGDFTFMVWEKSLKTNYSGTAIILSNQPEHANWAGYILGIKGNTPTLATMHNGNTTLNGTTNVTDNAWHHLTYIRQGTTLKLYVDGTPNGQYTGTLRNITNNKHTCFSYENHTSWHHFDGILDEATLFTRALSRDEINASINSTAHPLNHNFTGLADRSYYYYAYAIDTTGNRSTTDGRTLTIDTHAPWITGISATPSVIGFGYNVTIQANVTDNLTGLSIIKARITGPSYGGNQLQLQLNQTMTNTQGHTYQYLFTDSYKAGRYNYTIYAVDNATNTRIKAGPSFNVTASATINISTLKDTYTGTQYINLTDPPNPPQNYTITGRGLTWNTYYDTATGDNVLEAYQLPINYHNTTGGWTPINPTLTDLPTSHPAYSHGYRIGDDHGLYSVYFKPNFQSSWPVAFAYNKSQDPTHNIVRTALLGVEYLDPSHNWAHVRLQDAQSSQGQHTDNTIIYPGVFQGSDVIYTYGNTGLKETLLLSNTTKAYLQAHPPSAYGLNNQQTYLVFITKLDFTSLNAYTSDGPITGNTTITSHGIECKDILGTLKCALPLGNAYPVNQPDNTTVLTYRIIRLGNDWYLLSGLHVSTLNQMTFPVAIDPTITVYSSSNDGYCYVSSCTNYNVAWTSPSGTVNNTGISIYIGQKKNPLLQPTYSIYRGFLYFNTSMITSNSYVDNASLGLYKVGDYSTTDFKVTVQNGQPIYPHSPMQMTDYNKSKYSGNGGTFNTNAFGTGYNTLSLNSSGRGWINRTGITKLCLRSSHDISGTTPTGDEYVTITSDEFLGVGCQPKLTVSYRNHSKLKNTGSTTIRGYLHIQIQYYNSGQHAWVLDNDVVNDSSARVLSTGEQIGLDRFFNGHIRASNLWHGTGTYRVYTSFTDVNGTIYTCASNRKLEATYEFTKT